MTNVRGDGGEQHLAPVTSLFQAKSARKAEVPPAPDEQPDDAYDADGWWVNPEGEQPGPRHADAAADTVDDAQEQEQLAPVRPFPIKNRPVEAEQFTSTSVTPSSSEKSATLRALRQALEEHESHAEGPAHTEGSAGVEFVEENPTEAAEDALVRKLRRKGLSIQESLTYLRGLDIEDSVAHEAIDACVARGYLDDAVLAEQLVYSAVTKKAQGRRAVAQVLRTRGIPQDVAEIAMAELEDDDTERALAFARKKAPSLASVEPQAALRRLLGQLARRGFGGPDAMKAAREALAEVSGPRFR